MINNNNTRNEINILTNNAQTDRSEFAQRLDQQLLGSSIEVDEEQRKLNANIQALKAKKMMLNSGRQRKTDQSLEPIKQEADESKIRVDGQESMGERILSNASNQNVGHRVSGFNNMK